MLYGPYGTTRYSSGTMPGSYGYTGQHADATTGLDYYNARYYDASAGQFASADSVADGLNRYGYVQGNPTTFVDPSGHRRCSSDGSQCDDGDGHHKHGGGDDGYDPTHCHADAAICVAIWSTFHNGFTQWLLFTLVLSSTGMKFIRFILQMGQRLGDYFINWESSGPVGYNNDDGHIDLNYSLLGDRSPQAWAQAAGTLIHEVVEVYYNMAYGIGFYGASHHMEYVADHYGGKVEEEVSAQLGVPFDQYGKRKDHNLNTAVHHGYAEWNAIEGAGYNEPETQWENSFWAAALIGPYIVRPVNREWANDMGLTRSMLDAKSLANV